MGRRYADLLEQLEDKFLVGDGCWEATHTTPCGNPKKDGTKYRRAFIRVAGRTRFLHAVVWELFNGPVPAGLVLDHLCRNTRCVRPDHLEPVTQGENVARGDRHKIPRTHCAEGHLLDEANTVRRSGARVCRICRKRYFHEQYLKRTEGIVQRRYRVGSPS